MAHQANEVPFAGLAEAARASQLLLRSGLKGRFLWPAEFDPEIPVDAENLAWLCEQLCERRRHWLRAYNQPLGPAQPGEVLEGRLMAIDLAGSFGCAVLESEGGGLFLSNDTPAWATWVGYGWRPNASTHEEDSEWRSWLWTWIPQPFVEIVDLAILKNGCGNAEWWDDLRPLIG